jgi:hypothetical protein
MLPTSISLRRILTGISLILWSIQLTAQHDVQVLFMNPSRLKMHQVSRMFEGKVNRNGFVFYRIPAGADGEIVYKVNAYQASDKITIQFVNESSSAIYALFMDGLQKKVVYNGTLPKGAFVVGDELKIVRCKNTIIYYHNGRPFHTITLTDNNFVIRGEVHVTATANAQARIQFHTL